MSNAVAQELKALETDEIEVFDAFLGEKVLVVPPLMRILADNPRASEFLYHLGG